MKTVNEKRKSSLWLVCMVLITLSSCKYFVSDEEQEEELAVLRENQFLAIDSIRITYQTDLDEIESALDELRTNYGYVELGPNSTIELSQPQIDRINNNLSMIAEVLDENRTKIQSLESKLAAVSIGKKEIASSLNLLKQKLMDMQWQYDGLKDEFVKREQKIKELESNLSEAENSLGIMYNQVQKNKAKAEQKYLAFGTKKVLTETQVLKKEGKLFGQLVVNENMDPKELFPVNMYQTTSLSFDSPHPKIISKHPAESYTVENIDGDSSLLLINNPEMFWRTSNILVVTSN